MAWEGRVMGTTEAEQYLNQWRSPSIWAFQVLEKGERGVSEKERKMKG